MLKFSPTFIGDVPCLNSSENCSRIVAILFSVASLFILISNLPLHVSFMYFSFSAFVFFAFILFSSVFFAYPIGFFRLSSLSHSLSCTTQSRSIVYKEIIELFVPLLRAFAIIASLILYI